MKLVSFLNGENQERLGLYINGSIIDLQKTAAHFSVDLPSNMNDFLNGSATYLDKAKELNEKLSQQELSDIAVNNPSMLAPVPHPASCRDAYAFRQHVASARKNRGVDMIPEFDQFPVFYFTNHNSIIGEGDLVVEKDHLLKLDFELELAAVVGKKGRNIEAKDADDHIIGYTIMNDFSARQLQMEEMKLNLGPAKGKDFATAIGPWLVTKDELEDCLIKTDRGNQFDMKMTAKHNGGQISEGNAKDMTYTFAEIIERCSYGVDVFPGDVIGSGTVGTGCYLELNGTRRRLAQEKGEDYTPVWLENGDTIELAIDGLGVLTNKIVYNGDERSILSKKKNV